MHVRIAHPDLPHEEGKGIIVILLTMQPSGKQIQNQQHEK